MLSYVRKCNKYFIDSDALFFFHFSISEIKMQLKSRIIMTKILANAFSS